MSIMMLNESMSSEANIIIRSPPASSCTATTTAAAAFSSSSPPRLPTQSPITASTPVSTSSSSGYKKIIAGVTSNNHDYHVKRIQSSSSSGGSKNTSPESGDSEPINHKPSESVTEIRRTLKTPRLESIRSIESEYTDHYTSNRDTELLVNAQDMSILDDEDDVNDDMGSTSITMQPTIAFGSGSQNGDREDEEEHNMHYSKSLYFEDGERLVDFVLVYDKSNKDKDSQTVTKNLIRKQFSRSLIEEGLHLEKVKSNDEGLKFIKLHAPWDLLIRYAEVMKLKMPMKQIETSWRLVLDDEDPYSKGKFTATFSRDKMYLFHIPAKKELFFSPSIRSQIVDFILKRKTFTANVTVSEASSFGIDRLLSDGIFLACYPLHEGRLNDDLSSASMLFPNEEQQSTIDGSVVNDARTFKISPRLKLVKDWASLRNIFKKQPLDEIRRYFGVKIALYFAWLGFYTSMLVPASIVGVICFLFGWFTLQFDTPSKEICDEVYDKLPMCPICSINCGFWKMSDSCSSSKLSYLFDNPATVFFAVFMSFWATVYLEMWKRYSARITYRWDLSNLDKYEEYPRPEYLAKLSKGGKKRLNIITKMYEPYVPFWSRQFPNTLMSGGAVFLMIIIALGSVMFVVAGRVFLRAKLSANKDPTISENASIITSATAAAVNLLFIMMFNLVYGRFANYLTELEMPRNQSDFDNSLTLKMYILQFVNYYSSIFYIAFFKGKFAASPLDFKDDSNFAGRTQEECGIGGCLLELAIQLSIIMVGKQALNGAMEMTTPWLKWCVHKWRMRNRVESGSSVPQWESDFFLAQWNSQSLFSEYLEMVLQFGFVTIFVAAFPLAPLFALINNALEIRLDGMKIITAFRRPVAQRVKNIGIWYGILDSIGKLSVLTNAVIIAFTSDFIPRLLYYSKQKTMSGYINSTLSIFNISDLDLQRLPNRQELVEFGRKGITVCMYQGNRNPPSDPHPYQPSYEYWEELAIKLVFVLAFENVIAVTKMILRWAIPDVPSTLRQNIRQHAYLTNELIMQQELARAKEGECGSNRQRQSDVPSDA